MRLSFKHRLYPNRAQAEVLTGMLGAFCYLCDPSCSSASKPTGAGESAPESRNAVT